MNRLVAPAPSPSHDPDPARDPARDRGRDRGRGRRRGRGRERLSLRLFLPLLLLLTLLLAACGSSPKHYYFTLSYPLEQDRATAARPPLHPYRMYLKTFTTGVPYDRPQIVYRQSPYEYQYYTFRLWAAKPQHMVRELVEDHIEAARLVDEVSREYGDHLPDYELAAEVQAIEEYDSGDVWYGHLAMRFTLVRFADKTPIWHYDFDRKRKVHKKQPVYVVRTLSGILEEELRRVTADLDRVLSAERKVAPTLVMPPPASDDVAPAERVAPDVIAPQGAPAPAGKPAAAPERKPAGPTGQSPEDELIVPEEDGQ
jgi:ABC-type uncharacterized transport system auxiliary subunit